MGSFNVKNPNHFMSQIDIDKESQCWLPRRVEEATNRKQKDRKTTIEYEGRNTTWRRLAFKWHFKRDPEGYLQADSTCISQNCCNPLHMKECRHGNKELSDDDFLAAVASALDKLGR